MPSVDPADPLYARYEGVNFDNACQVDADCFRGGCNAEICTASQDVAGPCDVVPIPEGGCGCVDGQCIWHVEVCGCPDADGDGVCDTDDSDCNADGTPLQCRRAAPDCAPGTVPEIRNGCYTDRCVTWATCGAPCVDTDGDAVCDDVDPACGPNEVFCDVEPPMCPAGQVPESGIDCWTGRCVSWAECGQPPCPDVDDDGVCDDVDPICGPNEIVCDGLQPVCDEGQVPESANGCWTGRCVAWDACGQPIGEPCAAIQPGEFGQCAAILGWGIDPATGACNFVSGCGCDARCEGRIFETEEACTQACVAVEPPANDLGNDCQLDTDCNSGVCWDFSDYDQFCGGRACSLRCEADADCHAAFRAAGAPNPDESRCGADGKCAVLGTGFGAFFCQ